MARMMQTGTHPRTCEPDVDPASAVAVKASGLFEFVEDVAVADADAAAAGAADASTKHRNKGKIGACSSSIHESK